MVDIMALFCKQPPQTFAQVPTHASNSGCCLMFAFHPTTQLIKVVKGKKTCCVKKAGKKVFHLEMLINRGINYIFLK